MIVSCSNRCGRETGSPDRLCDECRWDKTKKAKEGGSIHPTSSYHTACLAGEGCRVSDGLTIRDYFAAKALPKYLEEAWGEEGGTESAAIGAYQMADAMLLERAK